MENVDSCLHPLVQPHVSRCFVGIKTAPKWLMIPMNSTPFISLFHHQFRSEITFVTSGDQYWRENQPFKFRSMTFLVGGFNPSKKYESQWEGLSHINYGKTNV